MAKPKQPVAKHQDSIKAKLYAASDAVTAAAANLAKAKQAYRDALQAQRQLKADARSQPTKVRPS